jgi:hypothetical protein
VAKGFVNLSRFKHGRATKRNSKQKDNSESEKKSEGKEEDLVIKRDELTCGSIGLLGPTFYVSPVHL